jgi:hypothetical protein
VPSGAYVIIRQLPERNGECEYQIKNAREPHDRVVRESQLSTTPSPNKRRIRAAADQSLAATGPDYTHFIAAKVSTTGRLLTLMRPIPG